MPVVFVESFGHYPTSMLPTKWSNTAGTISFTSSDSGIWDGSGGLFSRHVIDPPQSNCTVGVRYNADTPGGIICGMTGGYIDPNPPHDFIDVGEVLRFQSNAAGGLDIYQIGFPSNVLLMRSASPYFITNQPGYFEFQWPTMEGRVNGEVVDFVAVNSPTAWLIHGMSLSGIGGGNNSTAKDIYVSDDLDFLGDVVVTAQFPSSDNESVKDWYAWQGSPLVPHDPHYETIDEQSPDDSFSFISTYDIDESPQPDAPANLQEVFGYTNLTATREIICLQYVPRWLSDFTYPGALRILVQAPTLFVSPNVITGIAGQYITGGFGASNSTTVLSPTMIQYDNPVTGLPWVTADFNAGNFGYRNEV